MESTILATVALLFIGSTLSAQKTVYLDKQACWTDDKKKAVEYAVITKKSKEQTKVEFYTLDGRAKGVCNYADYTKSPRERVRNGQSTYLYANGKDSLVSIFKDNRLEGQQITYYPDGATKLVKIYKKGKLNGKIVGYYPDGKLRREESYTDGKCDGGKLLAADGNELAFEPYFIEAEFPGGMEALVTLLAKNIKYPADAVKAKIQGRVIIRFVVDKQGKMIAPQVVASVNQSLDSEAIRVVKAIAKTANWSPAKEDGETIRISYTIPVNFRLPY